MRTNDNQHIFQPKSLYDALSILKKHPDCLICAGCSDIQLRSKDLSTETLLTLSNIEELKRVYRSEHFLEIGSMVTLERLTRLKQGLAPRALLDWIFSIPFPQLRAVATLGGNQFADPQYISSAYYLSLADVQVELKRFGRSRWLSPDKLRTEQENIIAQGEILTRIRIPLVYTHQVYRSFYSREKKMFYAFCALATLRNGVLEKAKIIYLFDHLRSYYNRYAESCIIGRRIPISSRERKQFLLEVASMWEDTETWNISDALMRARLQNLSAWFIYTLTES